MDGRRWHIDGMGKNKHSPFSLLVGVTLSEVPGPDCGNLTLTLTLILTLTLNLTLI